MQLSPSELRKHVDYHPDGYFVRKNGKRAGSAKGKEYEQVMVAGKLYATHRLVFFWHHDRFPTQTDHINRDRYDNRIENLREVTEQQNKMNRRGSTKHKNCYWTGKKWMVSVGKDGKKYHGGYFETLEEALGKAEQLRNELHGEYACNSI